jgi:hypothetical protein
MINQLWNFIQVASAGVITIGGAGTIFVALYRWAKKPDVNRDEKLKGHDEKLDNDNRRLNDLERKQAETEEAMQMSGENRMNQVSASAAYWMYLMQQNMAGFGF